MEEFSRIEKQIGKLAGRLNQAYDQINVLSRRVDDLLEQNRRMAQRVEKVEQDRTGFPVTVSPEGGMFVEPLWKYTMAGPPTTAGAESDVYYVTPTSGEPSFPRTFVYNHAGICVSESRKVPGAAPFGKEEP